MTTISSQSNHIHCNSKDTIYGVECVVRNLEWTLNGHTNYNGELIGFMICYGWMN